MTNTGEVGGTCEHPLSDRYTQRLISWCGVCGAAELTPAGAWMRPDLADLEAQKQQLEEARRENERAKAMAEAIVGSQAAPTERHAWKQATKEAADFLKGKEPSSYATMLRDNAHWYEAQLTAANQELDQWRAGTRIRMDDVTTDSDREARILCIEDLSEQLTAANQRADEAERDRDEWKRTAEHGAEIIERQARQALQHQRTSVSEQPAG